MLLILNPNGRMIEEKVHFLLKISANEKDNTRIVVLET